MTPTLNMPSFIPVHFLCIHFPQCFIKQYCQLTKNYTAPCINVRTKNRQTDGHKANACTLSARCGKCNKILNCQCYKQTFVDKAVVSLCQCTIINADQIHVQQYGITVTNIHTGQYDICICHRCFYWR